MPTDLSSILRQAPLYAILDSGLQRNLVPMEFAVALLDAGVRVLQYRHKQRWGRASFELCCALAVRVHQAGGIFIVNDRADVAALCGADGVHIGQDDLPPEKARAFLGAGKLIGYSTHSRDQAAEADSLPVDYIAIGPVFPTMTKENPDPVVGLEMVRAVREITAKPLVAIGGITLENAPPVVAAGADAVAIISDLACGDVVARVRQFLSAVPTLNS